MRYALVSALATCLLAVSACQDRRRPEWTPVTVLPDGQVSYEGRTLSLNEFASSVRDPCSVQLISKKEVGFDLFSDVLQTLDTAGCEVIIHGSDAAEAGR